MTTVHIPFLQTGTLAVGGRLLDDAERSVQSHADRPSSLTKGHRACQGCAEALAARWVMDTAVEASDGKLVVANATGCLEVFSTLYPESAWKPPWIHSLFANAAAVATGIAASLHAQGRDDVRVLAQGGDGGTVDIGLAAVSGMFERNDDVLYVCYDNQGYMNTGVQRSSATPAAARTATTPAVGRSPGQAFGQGKSMVKIAMAHEIPYVASATPADLRDLEHKVRTAMSIRGARYLHVLVPCPVGWGSASSQSIALARAAVQSGIFPVVEARAGELTDVQRIRERADVEEYLRPQARFAHLFKPGGEDALARWRALADANIRRYDLLGERS
ncbi:thiamine pyrophosphate-dependent enzyme [Demequina sp. SYSU T00192]|uniref:Thiamine pyrophosphate-dependent enzyme n=1 Tax=Demequina litoralis TaxID=3051660 RepID=A0ABT8GCF6_9MICO|nr:thiamine pyrophosphate-dependent enzyme [Demequina sp. SYSU T00192]MDN4476820.1 thiamine pyrophosphate-dependent enzyme [Demequina sp. SYSU T00192]